MSLLVWLALVLFVAWIVLKLVLTVTGGLLHLLLVAAVIMFIVWLFGRMRGKTGV